MIQYIGRAEKKGQQSTFILLTSQQTQVKKLEEVEKILAKQAFLATGNLQPLILPSRTRSSPLAQEVDLDVSDNELMQGFETNQEVLKEFNDPTTEQLFELWSTDVDITS